MPPSPTTSSGQLDVTTGIAIAGLLVALLSFVIASVGLFLTVRRDRAAGRVRVRMVVSVGRGDYADSAPVMTVSLSNPERRAVTVQRAGLTSKRGDERRDFAGWRPKIVGEGFAGFGSAVSPFSGGIRLEPGDPSRSVKASLFRVRGAFYPEVPSWAWCEDSIGGVYWEAIPHDVQAAIRATKRRKKNEQPGEPFSIEIDDDEVIRPDQLYQSG